MFSVPKLRSSGNVTTFIIFIFLKSTHLRFQVSMTQVGGSNTPSFLSLLPSNQNHIKVPAAPAMNSKGSPLLVHSLCRYTHCSPFETLLHLGFPIPLSSFSLTLSDTRLAPKDCLLLHEALQRALGKELENWVTRINERGRENAGEEIRFNVSINYSDKISIALVLVNIYGIF